MALHALGSTLGGGIVGALIGRIGHILGRDWPASVWWGALIGLGVALLAREMGWLRFPIPQMKRQTVASWYLRFGPRWAAWLWGLDLGSGLTNYISFSGYWLLILAIVARGDLLFGLAALGLYGLGRGLWTALGPALLRWQPVCAAQHLDHLLVYRPTLFRWHRYGMTLLVTLLVVAAILRGEGGGMR